MKSRLAALFLFASTSLFAQSPAQQVNERIVVTAAAAPESLESTPASVTIITRRDIDEQQAHDVADVLREVPGLSLARTGSQGKSTTLFIRGGSSKQALVLWNGVEMNNAYLSGYDFGQLSTAGVEKVEVIRGPYSALYGSEAVSGVVNVLTTSPRSAVAVDLEGGGHGFKNGAVSGAFAASNWNANGSAELRDDNGFAPNDDERSDTFAGGVEFLPRTNVALALLARHNTFEVGIPRNINGDATAFVPTPRRRDGGTESQLSLPLRLDAGGIRYELRLARAQRIEHYNDPDAPFGAEFGNTDSQSRTARFTAQSQRTFAGVITAGGEFERNDVDHTDSFGLDVRHQSRDSHAIFLEDSFSHDIGATVLQLTAGARYDRFQTFGSQTSPRIAAALVAGGSKFRAAYGEGFRAPAIGELYAPFFGNPSLDAERSRNVEAGFDRYAGPSTLSVTAFRSDYDNLINYDTIANHFGNIDRARSRGIELGVTRRSGAMFGSISYTYLQALDLAKRKQLVRRPRHSGSATLGYDGRPFGADLVVVYAGERPDVTDLAPFGIVSNRSYTTADVVVRYEVRDFAPFVKVENATDVKYDEVFGYPSARRRFIAGVRYTTR